MARIPRAKMSWLLGAAGLFAISLFLPALVHDGATVWDGFKAAEFALFVPFVWSLPLGVLLGMLYPLFGVTLFGVLKGRAFATGVAIALLATMALWGVSPPAAPVANIFGGTTPGGQLGSGFWVWLASGACLLMASLDQKRPLPRRWAALGLGYAAIVAVSALIMTGSRREAARHATDAERRAVEAEKRAKKPAEPPLGQSRESTSVTQETE